MLEAMMDSYVIFWAMGVTAVVGIVSKLIVVFSMKRLVRAAGNMGKSTHKLMKLVKAKFEHAYMVADRVENIRTFVEKYLYEYKVWGLQLHSWRYLGRQAIWMCGILGATGAAISYQMGGMQEIVFQYGVWAAVGVVALFLVRTSTDENYQLEAAEMYMVEYLENTCAPRYQRQQVQQVQRMEKIIDEPVQEVQEEEIPVKTPEPEERPSQEMLLREILEEFLA